MGQAKEKQLKDKEPLLQEVGTGKSKTLYATNKAYLSQFNEDLATAVVEQSSFSEVFVTEFKDEHNFKLSLFIYDLMNGLLMHPLISEKLEDTKVLTKALKILPIKSVFLFEATEMYVAKYDKVKVGTPLVNNIKSGYAPSTFLKTDLLREDKEYSTIDVDTAMALQLLDVNSLEMLKEFSVEFGKMLKPMFKAFSMNLVAGEIALGIDSGNNMRLADFGVYVKDTKTNDVLDYETICTRLGL